jgi:hypothetical protein
MVEVAVVADMLEPTVLMILVLVVQAVMAPVGRY